MKKTDTSILEKGVYDWENVISKMKWFTDFKYVNPTEMDGEIMIFRNIEKPDYFNFDFENDIHDTFIYSTTGDKPLIDSNNIHDLNQSLTINLSESEYYKVYGLVLQGGKMGDNILLPRNIHIKVSKDNEIKTIKTNNYKKENNKEYYKLMGVDFNRDLTYDMREKSTGIRKIEDIKQIVWFDEPLYCNKIEIISEEDNCGVRCNVLFQQYQFKYKYTDYNELKDYMTENYTLNENEYDEPTEIQNFIEKFSHKYSKNKTFIEHQNIRLKELIHNSISNNIKEEYTDIYDDIKYTYMKDIIKETFTNKLNPLLDLGSNYELKELDSLIRLNIPKTYTINLYNENKKLVKTIKNYDCENYRKLKNPVWCRYINVKSTIKENYRVEGGLETLVKMMKDRGGDTSIDSEDTSFIGLSDDTIQSLDFSDWSNSQLEQEAQIIRINL